MYIAKACQIVDVLDINHSDSTIENEPIRVDDSEDTTTPSLSELRIPTRQSPYFDTVYVHHPIQTCFAPLLLNGLVYPCFSSSQSANEDDGSSPLQFVG